MYVYKHLTRNSCFRSYEIHKKFKILEILTSKYVYIETYLHFGCFLLNIGKIYTALLSAYEVLQR